MSLWMRNREDEASSEPEDWPDYWELEYGLRELQRAVDLWEFLADPRGQQLHRIMMGEFRRKDEEGRRVISLDLIRRLLSLLDGLGPALRSVTSPEYDLKPEDVERAQRQREIVHHWKRPDGSEVYTVANALGEVREVEQFLRRALNEKRTILVD